MSRAKRIHPGIWALPTWIGRAFLVEVDGGLVLFDTGARGSARRILGALRSMGRRPDEVQRILLSHHHADHVGGAREIRDVTGAPTLAHARDADVIRGDRPVPPLRREGRLAPLAPLFDKTARFAPCPVDVVLPDDVEEMPLGVGDLKVLHTPGHTMGSVSLLVPGRQAALLGDALFNFFGRLTLSWKIDTEDREAAARSAGRIAELDFDVACFGHGRVIRREAAERVRRLASTLG